MPSRRWTASAAPRSLAVILAGITLGAGRTACRGQRDAEVKALLALLSVFLSTCKRSKHLSRRRARSRSRSSSRRLARPTSPRACSPTACRSALGQRVLVVNRPGAGGAIGYRYVAAQKPDGYALVWNSNSISTTYHSGQLDFDYQAFDAVARVLSESVVLAVRSRLACEDPEGPRRRGEGEAQGDHASATPASAATRTSRSPRSFSAAGVAGQRGAVRRGAGGAEPARRARRRGGPAPRRACRRRSSRARCSLLARSSQARDPALARRADRAQSRASTSRSRPGAASPSPAGRLQT